jgi:DNA-binding response OmpR family regulator
VDSLNRVYEFCGFRLDPARRSLERGNGEPVAITAKAFDALVYLVETQARSSRGATLRARSGRRPSSRTTT